MQKPSILVHSCPRCRGDLYRDMLEADDEFVCLQCGRRLERNQLPQEVRRAPEPRRVRVA